MTIYLTVEEVIEQYGAEDLPPNSNNEPDEILCQKCINRAGDYIDTVLINAGIEMPFNEEIIDKLKSVSLSITRYNYKQKFASIPEFVKQDYELQLRMLTAFTKQYQKKGALRTINIIWEG